MEARTPAPTVVDFWFDPVCPYSWTASRWLHHVAGQAPLEVRHHVISLYALNEHRTDVDPTYRRAVEQTRGPARVAAAIAEIHDSDTVDKFYTHFGERNFDVWRYPDEAEQRESVRAALARAVLPAYLEDAMDDEANDDELRRATDVALALVGGDVGTPITQVDGVAFYGPVLNAIPRGAAALGILDGMRQLASFPQFYELKRTRHRPPVFT